MSDSPTKHRFATVTRLGPTQQVQSQLLSAITSGHYEPGSLLPSERELCEMFGVSRVSVREALAGLAATGLIEIQQGKGVFVRPRVDDEFAGPFALYIEMHRDQLTELLQVRGALDGLAASQAALHCDDAARERIQHAFDAFRDEAQGDADPQALTELDVAFHRAIADAGKGTLLPQLLTELNQLLIESRHILFARPGQPERSVSDHEEILEAIIAADEVSARHRASDHVQKMWSWVSGFTSSKAHLVGPSQDNSAG